MIAILNDSVGDISNILNIVIGLVFSIAFVVLIGGGIFALVRRIQINKAFKRQHSKNFQNYVEKLFFENKGFKYYCSPEKRFVFLTPYKKRTVDEDIEEDEEEESDDNSATVYCFLSPKGKKYILYTDEKSGKLAYLDPKLDGGVYKEFLGWIEGEYDE